MSTISKTALLAAILSGVLAIAVPAADTNLTAQAQLREAYVQIVNAECLAADGLWANAATCYEKACLAFEALQHAYPGWQGTLVERRIADCKNQMERLDREHAEMVALPPAQPPVTATVAAAPTNPAVARVARLQDELRQMRAILEQTNSSHATSHAVQAATASNAARAASMEIARLKQTIADRDRTCEVLRKELIVLERKLVAMEKKALPPRLSQPAAPLPPPTPQSKILASLIANEARTIQQRGDVEQAITLLTEAHALMPDNLSFRLLLGNAYCHTSRYNEAIALLKDIPDDPARAAELHLLRGSAYIGLGQLGAARHEMEVVLKLQPSSSTAHYNLAQVLFRLRPPDLEEVEKQYRLSLEDGGPRDSAFEAAIRAARIDLNLKEKKKTKVTSPSTAPANSPIPLPVSSPIP